MRAGGWIATTVTAALVAAAALGAGPATPTAAAALRPLHAVRGSAPAIVDDQDRQVLLRGVNVNQLGDYARNAPALDPVVPLREQDFADIAALGMDVVRLIVHWSALEPQRGVFDDAYVQRIRQAIGWAAAHDVYVVLDMHQDAWGKFIATPPGAECPEPLSAQVGWDGAPDWATITDGLPTCKLSIRELAPAVAQAWQSFWIDRNGIQGQLAAAWAHLAGAVAAEPAVAGYDLLNEPNPGYLPVATGATLLASYYARAIAAIRSAERAAPGGFAHIAFAEPGVEWSAVGTTLVWPSALVSDPQLVFAPHLYGGSLAVLPVDQGFDAAASAAQSLRTTVWSGEWGWFGDPTADAPQIAQYARDEDAHLWGGAWWDWRQACGDPHNIPAPGAQPTSISPSLHRYSCPDQTDLGIPATTRQILARAYVRAAPGRLTSLTSDPQSGAWEAHGRRGDGACDVDVWVPGDARPAVAGEHVSDLAARRVLGGWRVSGCARGTWALSSDGAETPDDDAAAVGDVGPGAGHAGRARHPRAHRRPHRVRSRRAAAPPRGRGRVR